MDKFKIIKTDLRKTEDEILTFATKVDRLFETKQVHSLILGLVLVTALCAGLGTFPTISSTYGKFLQLIETVVISIFVVELVARIIVTRQKFFMNYWNVFDLLVVSASLIPFSGGFAVLRILRVLHCINLLDLLPKTKHVIDGFLRAMPSIINVLFLEFVFIYTFSVMAYHLYGNVAPEKFGNVGISMYTLFSILGTLDWALLAAEIEDVAPHGWVFMLLYTLISGYILLNFVVGAILDAMNEAGVKDAKDKGTHELENKFNLLMMEIQALRQEIQHPPKK